MLCLYRDCEHATLCSIDPFSYQEHLKPSKTLFLVAKNQVFGGENLCFSIGLAGAPGNYKTCSFGLRRKDTFCFKDLCWSSEQSAFCSTGRFATVGILTAKKPVVKISTPVIFVKWNSHGKVLHPSKKTSPGKKLPCGIRFKEYLPKQGL